MGASNVFWGRGRWKIIFGDRILGLYIETNFMILENCFAFCLVKTRCGMRKLTSEGIMKGDFQGMKF